MMELTELEQLTSKYIPRDDWGTSPVFVVAANMNVPMNYDDPKLGKWIIPGEHWETVLQLLAAGKIGPQAKITIQGPTQFICVHSEFLKNEETLATLRGAGITGTLWFKHDADTLLNIHGPHACSLVSIEETLVIKNPSYDGAFSH